MFVGNVGSDSVGEINREFTELVSSLPSGQRAVGGFSKRVFDVSVSLLALLMCFPLMVIIALAIRAKSDGPVFYLHDRIGLRGEPFKCIKFRTMHTNGDALLAEYFQNNPCARDEFERTRKLAHDPRIIPGIGCVLRKLSLDELPQFLNVLMGDMSVVGPRPIIVEEVIRYGDASAEYLRARPGITGLWQVSGRSETTFEQRAQIDQHYVRDWTFAKDVRIVVRTIPAVLAQRGAY